METPIGDASNADKSVNVSDFEKLLLAMETRLTQKIEATNKTAREAVLQSRLTNDALELLEEKVDTNDAALRDVIAENQEKVMGVVKENIKDMVNEQLKAVGFDPELSAGLLETPARPSVSVSYAATAAELPKQLLVSTIKKKLLTQDDRREERFWSCRKSLRFWPVTTPDRKGLDDFLIHKLKMDRAFVEEEVGACEIRKHRDPRAKVKDEIIVEFETKEIRDMIKAQGPNLANFQDAVRMRLHLPNHLQKDFKSLMGLSYQLKKKHPHLKRNVKFDENDEDGAD